MRELVLLPGFMCDVDLWSDMMPALAALGRPHFGNVYEDDSLDGMARRVLAESPKRFVLIGFSMGGFVARIAALMAPERVAGIAFICSSARGQTPAEDAHKQTRIDALNAPGARGGSARTFSQALHPDRERDPVLVERLRGMTRRLGKDVMIRQLAPARADGYTDLERIACPSLVIAARQDRLRRFEETERMAKHLPNSRFAVVEDCGHMAPLERPRELSALLTEWVAANGL